ncbi:peptidoglycan-binding protein [Streptomyces avermitilis]|uniref:peptidoglycan-binding protein n=1 Tax=Streptomyces avermitilis TaxID=33903 RepID=UPI0036B6499C
MTAPDEIRERAQDEQTDESPTAGDPSGETSGALQLHTAGEVSRRGARDLDSVDQGRLDTRGEDSPDTSRESRPDTAVDGGAEGGGDGAGTTPAPVSRRRRRPLRTSLIVVIAIAVAAAAGAATTGVFGGDGSDVANASASTPPRTAKVQRTTLTRTETVDGNLGFGDASTVQAPAAAGPGAGTVTWVPTAGDIVKRGGTVYKVDEQKVPLLYGSVPFYRTMKDGTEGTDVATLEKNLAALGYDGFVVDDTYNASTAAAVREWQEDLGREKTGTVRPSDAVVASGARRVAEVKAVTGAPPNGPVVTWTGTERIVSVALDVQYEDIVAKGAKATVTLPDNTTVNAEVTDVGSPTTPQSGDSQGAAGGAAGQSGSSSKKATLPVELKVADQKGLGRYQAAAVKISLKAQTRKNVLAVPINALVAQRGGGYAVQAVESDGVHAKPVKVGMFADSMVEVSGPGITAGTVVGVPK